MAQRGLEARGSSGTAFGGREYLGALGQGLGESGSDFQGPFAASEGVSGLFGMLRQGFVGVWGTWAGFGGGFGPVVVLWQGLGVFGAGFRVPRTGFGGYLEVWWVHPSWQLSSHPVACSLFHSGVWERIRRAKARKTHLSR